MSYEVNGMTQYPERRVYDQMKQRCNNANNPNYKGWGKRGIKVCSRWEHSFRAFMEDMGKRPLGTTLDRIDNDGDYTPENCRWATPKQQANNRRSTRWVTINGHKKTLQQWIDQSGIKSTTVIMRITKYGWSIKEALGMEIRNVSK